LPAPEHLKLDAALPRCRAPEYCNSTTSILGWLERRCTLCCRTSSAKLISCRNSSIGKNQTQRPVFETFRKTAWCVYAPNVAHFVPPETTSFDWDAFPRTNLLLHRTRRSDDVREIDPLSLVLSFPPQFDQGTFDLRTSGCRPPWAVVALAALERRRLADRPIVPARNGSANEGMRRSKTACAPAVTWPSQGVSPPLRITSHPLVYSLQPIPVSGVAGEPMISR
jgi:hypothetical protein